MAVISMGVREADMQPLAMITDGKRLFEVLRVRAPVRQANAGLMGSPIVTKGRVLMQDQQSFETLEMGLPLGRIWRLVRPAPDSAPDFI